MGDDEAGKNDTGEEERYRWTWMAQKNWEKKNGGKKKTGGLEAQSGDLEAEWWERCTRRQGVTIARAMGTWPDNARRKEKEKEAKAKEMAKEKATEEKEDMGKEDMGTKEWAKEDLAKEEAGKEEWEVKISREVKGRKEEDKKVLDTRGRVSSVEKLGIRRQSAWWDGCKEWRKTPRWKRAQWETWAHFGMLEELTRRMGGRRDVVEETVTQ